MKLNDIFNFGKFKGSSLKKVMAEHGSYVGWCLENIPNFHIQPKELESVFLTNYNIWKASHKGMTVKYTPNDKSYLDIGISSIQRGMIDRLNEDICYWIS